MRKKALVIMACALSASMATAHAEESTYGAVMGSVVKRDTDLQTKYGWGLAGLVGAPISGNLNWEVNAFTSQNDFKNSTADLPSYGLGADLRYNLANGGLVPFVLGGVGVQGDDYNDFGGPMRHAPFIDLGVGALIPLTEGLGLRAELKGYVEQWSTFPGSNTAFDARFNLGLQFGGDKPRPRPVAAVPPPPPPPPMSVPQTHPKPEPMAAMPAPPPPAPAKPKPVVERFALKGVNFEFDSDKITKDSTPKLDAVVKTLTAHQDVSIQVDGFTDSTGADAHNLQLSQKRADSVMKYFETHGIAASRMTAKGHGEADPIASNATKAGRAENRRVELNQK